MLYKLLLFHFQICKSMLIHTLFYIHVLLTARLAAPYRGVLRATGGPAIRSTIIITITIIADY